MNTIKLPDTTECTIAVIGLGYVGLPLAIEFAKNKDCLSKKLFKRKVIGFDINLERLESLKNCIDSTKELKKDDFKYLKKINLTNDNKVISQANVFIVTVPTPIDQKNNPCLKALKNASQIVGEAIRLKNKNDIKPIIVFESTVYPGATEEVCIPIIEKVSNLNLNKDFFCGFSPERINPGDNKNKLDSIIKVTSGSNKISAIWIDNFYKSIIKVGTHLTSNIKVAETAKVIENTQRDLNIALMNELSKICHLAQIDTIEVINAAATKWNFLDFRPGLVGGHCIGVDPYYLTYKSQDLGYNPEVVLAGRKINNSMPDWIIDRVSLGLSHKNKTIKGSQILIMGLTFKENCPDIRNSKSITLIKKIKAHDVSLTIWDGWADINECKKSHNLDIVNSFPKNKKFSAVICLVKHNEFMKLTYKEWQNLIEKEGIYFDLKGIIPKSLNPIRP